MAEMLEAAIHYVRDLGFAVHPLKPRSKEPATANGLKDATVDVDQIKQAWGSRPTMNLAAATGVASGNVFVIDVDVDNDSGKDGMEVLRAWEREHGELPETVTAITGRGGLHLFYRSENPVRGSVNEDVSVDIRGEGNYVMLSPSIHPNGRKVEWENHPDDFEIAEADENVMAFVNSVRKVKPASQKFKAPKEIREGGRNRKLFEMACSLQAQEWDDDAIFATVETFNNMKCKPPLQTADIEKIVRSAVDRYPKGTDLSVPKEEPQQAGRGRPRKFNHALIAKRLIAEHGACFVDGMPAVKDGDVYKVGWMDLNHAILDMADDCTTQNRREACAYIEIRAPRLRQSPPRYVAFTNGVLDVETMELSDYSDGMVIPNVIPHRWNPYASCREVDSTLRKVACGDPGMELNLSEVMGLCMYRSAKFGYCPILLGSGSNGKSTYISMLKSLLGAVNVSSLDIGVIGQRFQSGNLVGKLANLGDDISNEYIPGDVLAVIKKVATGNTVFTDVKGGQGFDFDPYCTMVFSANKFPRLGDSSDGMMRRLFPLQFNAKFSSSDPDFDPDIADKLASEEACEYMCSIGIDGLRRVLANNELTPNNRSKTMADDIKADNDTVLQWIDAEGLDETFAIGERPQGIYSSYHEWCLDNGCKAVGSRSFNTTVWHKWHVKSVPNGHGDRNGKRVTVRVYRKEL